jgi:hypothetical protein
MMNEDPKKVSHRHMKKRVEQVKKDNLKRYQTDSKRRLVKNVATKFTTTMIGALSQFEQRFGELWGIDKDYHDLTPEERYWRNLWEEARAEILNNGNNQSRACQDEISQYTMTWDRYHTDFRMVNDGKNTTVKWKDE